MKTFTLPSDSKWKLIGVPYWDSLKKYKVVLAECECGNQVVHTLRNLRISKQCRLCFNKSKEVSDKTTLIIHLLKTTSLRNCEIAKEVGVSRERVRTLRDKYRIDKQKNRKKEIPDKVKEQLGTMADGKLAVKLGVSISTIRYWRKKANIKPLKVKKELILPADCKWEIVGVPFLVKGNIPMKCGCGLTANVLISNVRSGRSKACIKCAGIARRGKERKKKIK